MTLLIKSIHVRVWPRCAALILRFLQADDNTSALRNIRKECTLTFRPAFREGPRKAKQKRSASSARRSARVFSLLNSPARLWASLCQSKPGEPTNHRCSAPGESSSDPRFLTPSKCT